MPTQLAQLQGTHTWLITGVAGFIGAHLLSKLLAHNQRVIGIDNFSTGFKHNLNRIQQQVTATQWQGFQFFRGDILDAEIMQQALQDVDYILHHAAVSSVPASLDNPKLAHAVNVSGFEQLLELARNNKVKRVVYASSSAVYGDCQRVPAQESHLGQLLSPYALGKRCNELYAATYQRCYGLESVGLRYFNVFGLGQNPNSDYSAVIPKWLERISQGKPAVIFGDGLTTRDFCPVANVVEANLLAALAPLKADISPVYNVGLGREMTLNHLHQQICEQWQQVGGQVAAPAEYKDFRVGDVRASCADTSLFEQEMGFAGAVSVAEGLQELVHYYNEACAQEVN